MPPSLTIKIYLAITRSNYSLRIYKKFILHTNQQHVNAGKKIKFQPSSFCLVFFIFFMLFHQLLFLFRIYPFSILLLLLQDQHDMKFFKKRLNKRKLTKSLTETALIAPPTTTAHQHDNNKPLPPSPSLASMPQQAPTASVAAKDAEATNSDSWLELSLPNDFSSSLDIPQLQTTSNPLEINTSKSLVQESESITETSLFSYPDNHIDTTTDDEPSKPDEQEKSVASVAATLEPSSSARPDHVDRDNQQDER